MKRIFKRIPILLFSLICAAATSDSVKNVLIIGDSISIGYTPFVQKALASDINVVHNPGNGGSTERGLDSIETWVSKREWDVILFNFGLHDLVRKDSLNKYDVTGKISVPVEKYKENLNKIVSRLRQTTATLIFINTTVVPENSSGRKVEDPAIYNAAALEIMNANSIRVLDLYATSQAVHPENSKPGNVHYTDKGYELLAAPIIKSINAILKK
ncbi:MAG: SGNH/GDSL hydrolase family protein [Prolixibacteraceae bacterium]